MRPRDHAIRRVAAKAGAGKVGRGLDTKMEGAVTAERDIAEESGRSNNDGISGTKPF